MKLEGHGHRLTSMVAQAVPPCSEMAMTMSESTPVHLYSCLTLKGTSLYVRTNCIEKQMLQFIAHFPINTTPLPSLHLQPMVLKISAVFLIAPTHPII